MKKVSERKCPECGSEKVHNTGRNSDGAKPAEHGAAVAVASDVKHPIFVCDECEIRFVTG